MNHVARNIGLPQIEVAAFERRCDEAGIDATDIALSGQDYGPREHSRRVVTVQKGSNAATFEAIHQDSAWVASLIGIVKAWK